MTRLEKAVKAVIDNFEDCEIEGSSLYACVELHLMHELEEAFENRKFGKRK